MTILNKFTWMVFLLFLLSCKQEGELKGASFQEEGDGASSAREISESPDEPGKENDENTDDSKDTLILTQENTVCDPLGSSSGGTAVNGLLGSLYYSQNRYSKAQDYIQKGTKADVHLLLSHINVPTRKFDLGFETEAGQLILNANGVPLYEDFALDLESKLILGQGDEPGFYEFAVLGDDGVNVFLNNEKIISMDYQTPTKLGCDQKYIYLDHSSRVPLRLEYFQGPRYHIALILLWRRVGLNEPSQKVNDPKCNQSGNDLWFNSNVVPSQPKTAYLGLLERGWKVIQPNNYLLSEKISENPCETDEDDGDNNPPGGGGIIGV